MKFFAYLDDGINWFIALEPHWKILIGVIVGLILGAIAYREWREK